jgi:transposase-like protein
MSDFTLSPIDSREHVCPRCRSEAIVGLGRIFAGGDGVRCEYRCAACATAFWLAAERRLGSPDRRAS